jgi:RNA polymerase sigma-70 factor, ECF subfamily
VTDTDAELLERLRAGDEAAFAALVRRYHPALVRIARSFVPSQAIAEEVAQDTWVGVIRGLDRFEGRSSFKTWLYRIVANRARSTGSRERRSVALGTGEEAAVPASRFDGGGQWSDPPTPWADAVDDRVLAETLAGPIRDAIAGLPDGQRTVVMMRDVDGLSAAEVCDILGITEGNQRVLLHRGRARIRGALERAMGDG